MEHGTVDQLNVSSFVYLLVCVLSENLILAEFTHRIREKYFCESANELTVNSRVVLELGGVDGYSRLFES